VIIGLVTLLSITKVDVIEREPPDELHTQAPSA